MDGREAVFIAARRVSTGRLCASSSESLMTKSRLDRIRFLGRITGGVSGSMRVRAGESC